MSDTSLSRSKSDVAPPTALRQYFGQAEDDIFDKIVPQQANKPDSHPTSHSMPSFYKTTDSQPSLSNDLKSSFTASVSFKKDSDEAPKIFSYFSSAAEPPTTTAKDVEGKVFFDLVSQQQQIPAVITHNSQSVSSVTTKPPHETVSHPVRHFWVLKPESQAVFEKLKASPGTFFPEKEHLTMPGLVLIEELGDPVKDQVKHFDGPAAAALRQVPTADSVSQDLHGIRYLVQANCYRAAVTLCGRLLTEWGQGAKMASHPSKHSPYSLQLWYTRLSLLVLTQQFSVAQSEAAAFGQLNTPDLFYEFYPDTYPGLTGCMASFSFRLLLAELPQLNNNASQAMDNLSRILVTLREFISNLQKGIAEDGQKRSSFDSADVWKDREIKVLSSMATISIASKDYTNAITLLNKIIDKSPTSPELHATLGRCYLQNGDVRMAQKAFSQSSLLRSAKAENKVNAHVDAAYIAIAQNAYADACKQFESALKLDPDNPMLLNNMAVCMLYTGRMKDAVALLEEAIGRRPDLLLQESILLNVCTLYELESSLTVQRKLGMLRLVAQWKGDSFNIASLKLQPQNQS
nr:EOG090X0439 [Triops cancriformis]